MHPLYYIVTVLNVKNISAFVAEAPEKKSREDAHVTAA